jgi:hypothetical protein
VVVKRFGPLKIKSIADFICKVEKIVKKSPVKNITTKYLQNITAIDLFKKVTFKDSKIPNCKLLIKLKR